MAGEDSFTSHLLADPYATAAEYAEIVVSVEEGLS
jgi:hypothetical protein